MNDKLVEKHIFESTHQDVVKRTDSKSLFLSILLLLAGVVLFIVYGQLGNISSEIPLTLMVLAMGLLLLGLYVMIWKSKSLVFEPTGSKVLMNSLSFDIKELVKLERMIKSGSFSSENIVINEKGSVRLDYLISEDSQFVAVQLFQFSSFKFTADTPITYFRGEQAVEVSAFLKQFN
ncbi:hypothetical protein [uncultured Bacteroides sp.]|uniref:hypothetical protein n=1 Tax=uncultured Bacteroides sp. TaxID=162156 RepID=UPI002AAA901B|nr:hypothetical protein [uncultured Bacteroides sp.]